MKKHTDLLRDLLQELDKKVTTHGKKDLIRLFEFLQDFEERSRKGLIEEPIKIGMFDAIARPQGVNWKAAIDEIDDLASVEDAEAFEDGDVEYEVCCPECGDTHHDYDHECEDEYGYEDEYEDTDEDY